MIEDPSPDRHKPVKSIKFKATLKPIAQAASELIDNRLDAPLQRKDNEALLRHLDQQFSHLMEAARQKREAKQAPASTNPIMRPAHQVGPTPMDLAALQVFQQQRSGPRTGLPAQAGGPRANNLGTMAPRRGLGPAVYIGFDCEWTYSKQGRNRVLSVQFFIVGPTGERYSKVLDLAGGDAIEARPSLAEALNDLLDEAEEHCIFEDWPCEVVFIGFFTRADIPVFRDFKEFRYQLDGVGGSLATVKRPANIELPMSDRRQEHLKARYSYVVGSGFEPRLLSVRLVDASRLAPPGSSVAKLGTWLGLKKLELPAGYTKADMARFQREKPTEFHEYGLRDAEVAVTYVLWVFWFCNRHLGLKGLSATASGLAVRLAEMCIRNDGVHVDVALNFETKQLSQWNNKTGRPVTKKERFPKRIRAWLEPFLSDTYQGGRNECFWFGPTSRSRIYDPDLAGAYVAGLAYGMVLDYDRAVMTQDVERFKGHVAGYAHVVFSFPAGTPYPALPVEVTNRGLWFPVAGESLCTAPEIELALLMGASIQILFGIVIPWLDRDTVFSRSQEATGADRLKKKKTQSTMVELLMADASDDEDVMVPADNMKFPPLHHDDEGYRVFESFAIYIRTMRSKFARKSLPFEFVKLLGNSAYGKTGQGFKAKRTFGPKEMDSVTIGTSRISEAAVAALVCGFIRAVLGEILWKLPPGARAVSVTTDGMLIDVPIESLDLSGVMCRRFQALVDRIAPGTGMLELKHQVKQIFAIRTRGQLTGEADGDHPIVVAKAGVKPVHDGDEARSKWLRTSEGENAYMLDLVVNRFAGQKLPRESMMSMRDQLLNGWDLQMQTSEVKLNLEFDFKRKPVNPQMIKIESLGLDHLAFDTVPWETAEEGALVRTIFDKWRETRCLKTMEDWHDWQAFLAFYMSNRRRQQQRATAPPLPLSGSEAENGAGAPSGSKVVRCTTGQVYATKETGHLGVAVRMFLTAYVQRAWGLLHVDLSQAQLAAWLTAQGYAVKPYTIKNAGRSQLHEQVVPASVDVMTFLAMVKSRFTELEIERFLVIA